MNCSKAAARCFYILLARWYILTLGYSLFNDETLLISSNLSPCLFIVTAVAKVTRDRMIENWKFTEGEHYGDGGEKPDLDYGSGYPSDPKCKAWMARHLKFDKLFMYPDLVRFSWGPVKDACKEKGVSVGWEADEEDTGLGQQQGAMKAFMAGEDQGAAKKPRLAYFESRKLKRVSKLVSN